MRPYGHTKNRSYILYIHDFIQSFSSNYWMKINFEFQNVVMQILKFFPCV
jgi:hypothetical protein